jgi:hypothetical protein
MHARVVRFTGADQQAIDNVKARVEEAGGPPEGVRATGMKMLYDGEQGTSVFIAFFDNEQDMRDADRVLDAMDAGDTPGQRASIDRCEVVIERDA